MAIFVSVVLKGFKMQEKIKEILGVFLKIPKEQIVASTIIDRTAVSSSILLHRMYAKLASEGIEVRNYQEVKNFADLLERVAGNKDASGVTMVSPGSIINETAISVATGLQDNNKGVGIDMELLSAMPATEDFREDSFYTMNFTGAEIAYCILQTNPYASFGGLFAAKEAIVKADNSYKNKAFNTIQIQHLPEGKPFHPAFNISISHTAEMAVALAIPIKAGNHVSTGVVNSELAKPAKNGASAGMWLLLLISLALSLTSLFLLTRK
jgi:phosphopantetheine--protein transferase-like protein